MKKVIDGIIYDTEAAIEVASDDDPVSSAWWALYRTKEGAFFEVIADHGGEVDRFIPLTNLKARAFLERHANHLVEQFFGPLREPSQMRFSRRTVVAAIEVMEGAIRTHADLTRRLLKFSPELAVRCGTEGGALADRFNNLIKIFDEQPNRRTDDGDLLGEQLVEMAVSQLRVPRRVQWGKPEEPLAQVSSFLRALERDGFTITDGSLRRTLPSDVQLPQAEDDISRLLKKHAFQTPKGHLDQALDAHTRGDWASANAQLRSFFEGLLDDIAIKLDASAATLPSSENRRSQLAKIGFLDEKLNEWSSDGKNYINGILKRLHPSGSHPGLSDQEDSTFRRHIVLLTARLLLVRFDQRSKS